MPEQIILAGVLAEPPLRDVFAPEAEAVSIRIAGQAMRAVRVKASAALWRWAEVMGLAPVSCDIPADFPALVLAEGDARAHAHLARDILSLPADRPAADIAARLPMMRVAAAARCRGEAEGRVSDLLPPTTPSRLDLQERRQPYANFYAVDEYRLRHKTSDGGWSEPLERAVLISGDAAIVLPWDPVRDRVLIIDQFRLGPVGRGQEQLWVLEPVAGRVDPLEVPEEAARREAREEANVELDRLYALAPFFPTPGTSSEMYYCFVGTCDLPDGSAGQGGLAEEHEDIRGHLMARSELSARVARGEVQCAPLIVLSLWLDRMVEAGNLAPM